MSDIDPSRTSALPAMRFPLPLATKRLEIRAFSMADADALYAIHCDPQACRYMNGTLNRSESRKNLAALIKRFDASGYGPFAVSLLATREVVGWAGVQQLPGFERIELLFAFQRSHWRKGFASEASQALLEQCFEHLSLDEVVASVDPENLPSIAVLKQLGFQLEGAFTHKVAPVDGHLYVLSAERFCRIGLAP